VTETLPAFLARHADLAKVEGPRAAAAAFFREARYGLFMHYGLYSLLERHEWVQLREKIPVAEYAKLKDRFTAERFDADAIADFAVRCGMRYVNITTRHHDSFCLWDTQETDFSSASSAARRDLVGELAAACERRDLALFLYYSHGRDWRHPHAPMNDEWGGSARPEYDPPEPSYAYGADHDLGRYLAFVERQIAELVTRYPTVGGIWLDGIGVPLSGDPAKFRCPELYERIRYLSPHVLISYKQGLTGTEDFFAPEHRRPKAGDDPKRVGRVAEHPERPVEICTTMTVEPGSWGCFKGARHRTEAGVWEALVSAADSNANLLLNTGPLPDGSLDPQDVEVMLRAGERIGREGLPPLSPE
jgi:alpha-L-fucosidase